MEPLRAGKCSRVPAMSQLVLTWAGVNALPPSIAEDDASVSVYLSLTIRITTNLSVS